MSEQRKLNWQAFPIALIVVSIYLVVGFVAHVWHPTWLIFFAIPLYHWTVDMIKNKRIAGLPTFIAVVVSLTVFLVIGFTLKTWHPTWLVFLLIPLTGSLEFFFEGGVRGQVKKAGDKIKEKIGIDTDDNDGHADIE